jgi:hypothetical protein
MREAMRCVDPGLHHAHYQAMRQSIHIRKAHVQSGRHVQGLSSHVREELAPMCAVESF